MTTPTHDAGPSPDASGPVTIIPPPPAPPRAALWRRVLCRVLGHDYDPNREFLINLLAYAHGEFELSDAAVYCVRCGVRLDDPRRPLTQLLHANDRRAADERIVRDAPTGK